MKNGLDTDISINIDGVDIRWDLTKGGLDFLGTSSTLFWNDPSLLNMFRPLVHEIGKDMFRLQVAHSSSLGTDEDYDVMVTQLGETFEEGFLNWGKAVGAAGWGTFEIEDIDPEKCRAKVIVRDPWELHMQKRLDSSESWGCPFIQGKIIGIFSSAFKSTCWADEKYYLEEDDLRVEFDIYLHELTIEEELEKFRKRRENEKIQALEKIIEEKIKERDELLEKNKAQEEHLLIRSRMAQMGEMISMIAHQWRQPLNAISSASINLQMKLELETFDLEKPEERAACTDYYAKRLRAIDGYVQNMTTTIDDFRNFYKPNKKSVRLKLEDIISRSLNIIQASLVADKIAIIEEYDSPDEIEVYDTELLQVILNLLKNSQDNFKEKKTKDPYIKIMTDEKRISICDNGGGIPEDVIEKIFDPYFSTKGEKNGTGLGLYMSKTIVERHHDGTLSVENHDDAHGAVLGACFTIELGTSSP